MEDALIQCFAEVLTYTYMCEIFCNSILAIAFGNSSCSLIIQPLVTECIYIHILFGNIILCVHNISAVSWHII